jgi:hypothetical protein
MKWYRFIFEDGYCFEARGLSKLEKAVEEREHGKLISKIRIE